MGWHAEYCSWVEYSGVLNTCIEKGCVKNRQDLYQSPTNFTRYGRPAIETH
jgi:hypothetical protein